MMRENVIVKRAIPYSEMIETQEVVLPVTLHRDMIREPDASVSLVSHSSVQVAYCKFGGKVASRTRH